MPSNVKLFWWLSVAIAAYWVLGFAWQLAFPSAHYLAVLAKFPPHLREEVQRADLENSIVGTVFRCGVTLGFAALAAFRRQNWARWAYAIAFLLRELLPWIFAGYVYLVPAYGANYRQAFLATLWESTVAEWSNPLNYLVPIAAVVAIVAVFTGNARDWFRRPGASA